MIGFFARPHLHCCFSTMVQNWLLDAIN